MNKVSLMSVEIRQVSWRTDKNALRSIRHKVFVQEQRVAENLEWDGLDEKAIHLLAVSSDNIPVATARMLANAHIGRMAVLRSWRQQGIGSTLLLSLIEIASKQGHSQVALDAQVHAVAFYESFGFIVTSHVFMDAGIPHKKMRRVINCSG